MTKEELDLYAKIINLPPDKRAKALEDEDLRNFYRDTMLTIQDAAGPSVMDEPGAGLKYKDESPPGLSLADRAIVKNFGNKQLDAIHYLMKKYPGADFTLQGKEIMMQPSGTDVWYPLDPSSFEFSDITDVGTDVAKGVASTGLGALGAAIGAGAFPLNPIAGARGGSAVGSGLGEAAVDIPSQMIGKLLGVNESLDLPGTAQRAGLSAILGPLVGGSKISPGKINTDFVKNYLLKNGVDKRVIETSTEQELMSMFNNNLRGAAEWVFDKVRAGGKGALAGLSGKISDMGAGTEFVDRLFSGKFGGLKGLNKSPELLQREARSTAEELRSGLSDITKGAKDIIGEELGAKRGASDVYISNSQALSDLDSLHQFLVEKYSNASSPKMAKPYLDAIKSVAKTRKELMTQSGSMRPEEAMNISSKIMTDLDKFLNPDQKLAVDMSKLSPVEKLVSKTYAKLSDELKKSADEAVGAAPEAARYARVSEMAKQNKPLVGDKSQATPSIRNTVDEMFTPGSGQSSFDKLAEDTYLTLQERYPKNPEKVISEYRKFMEKSKELFATDYYAGARQQGATPPLSIGRVVGAAAPAVGLAPSKSLIKGGYIAGKTLSPIMTAAEKSAPAWLQPIYDMLNQGTLDPENQKILNEYAAPEE